MSYDTSSRSYTAAQCFFCGLMLGSAAAILFAPVSGSDARRRLKEKVQSGTDVVSEQLSRTADAARGLTNDLVEQGKEVIAEKTSRVRGAVDAAKSAYRQSTSEYHNQTV